VRETDCTWWRARHFAFSWTAVGMERNPVVYHDTMCDLTRRGGRARLGWVGCWVG
jgi:hypothetical protein